MPAKIDRSCLPRDSGVYYYLSTLDNDTSGIEVHYFQLYTTVARCGYFHITSDSKKLTLNAVSDTLLR